VDEILFYRETENRVYFKAKGHITANACLELRNRVLVRMQETPAPEGIHVDLSECEYMDSTFMGLLVGFNKRLTAITGNAIVLYDVNDTCYGLLDALGIAGLVVFKRGTAEFPPEMEELGTPGLANPEFIKNAHENLMVLSERNQKKFELLNSVLTASTDKKGSRR
jgi:anti-anti-sigma factor